MKKFAAKALDVTDYVAEGKIDYLASLTNNDSDELAKTAHIPSKDEVDNLPGDDFAVVMFHPNLGFMKKFAMSDKYITKLNLKIFQDNYGEYPDEVVKTAAHYFQKAAKFFKLEFPEELKKFAAGKHISNVVDLDLVDSKAWHAKRGMTKQATTVEYALPDQKRYPLQTKEHIKLAIAYLDKQHQRMAPLDALTFAGRTKLAADRAQVSYEDTILSKYANIDASKFNENFPYYVRARKGYVATEDAPVYDELIEKSAGLGVIKTAEVLEKIDRHFGVDAKWGVSLEDPYFSTLSFKKEASCMHKGKKIKHSKMIKAASSIVDAATLEDLSGPEGMDVFESLPLPLRNKIVANIK